jgi:hypothetical protein
MFAPAKNTSIMESIKDYIRMLFSIDRDRVRFLSPYEKVAYTESLRKRIKWGVFGFLGMIASGMVLYQRSKLISFLLKMLTNRYWNRRISKLSLFFSYFLEAKL